jgi:hypothetical protein
MIARFKSWYRAHHLKRLEAEAQYYATAFAQAKMRLLSAQLQAKEDSEANGEPSR